MCRPNSRASAKKSKSTYAVAGFPRQSKKNRSSNRPAAADGALSQRLATQLFRMNVPDDLYYAESHEWLRLDGETGTVGITDHAQHELSDVVYVELPTVGAQVKARD